MTRRSQPVSRSRQRALLLSVTALCAALLSIGCDTPKEKPAPLPLEKTELPTVEPPPRAVLTALPPLAIDDVSPKVGATRAFVTNSQGKENPLEVEQLRADFSAAQPFIEGRDVTVDVHRKAKAEWVYLYLRELFPKRPRSVTLRGETRDEFPKSIEFVDPGSGKSLPPCTLVAFISKDRSTSVWKVSGGAARRRPRGLSGPDLSRTADTIVSALKGCESDVMVVHAIPEVEWGMIYDLAGAGLSAPKSTLKRALLPGVRPTPGQPLTFD